MSDEDKLRAYLKRATVDLHDTRRRVHELEARSSEPIAIVGMSCRYPGGVGSPEDLWGLVASGSDAIGGFPTDRGWDLDGLFDPDPDHPATSYANEAGFLHDAPEFDAEFFGISPREALTMDPQQRLWLEASWEAVEDAQLDPSSLSGSQTGVFAGVLRHDYGVSLKTVPEHLEGYFTTGIAASVLSGRVAYVFGLEGPAVTVDTACSSSLVALHLACQSLRTDECSLAFAGGVSVFNSPDLFVEFSRQRGLAQDGRCKSFADAADGAGFSEGVGVVLLERLSDAQRNGHRVLAVVRGSATNQDGASNGLTAPNGPSQERVIRQALMNAGLEPADVDAVEAHGTGTTLGDPIEAQALLATYGRERRAGRPLWLGSAKSNIGHSQAAAGVAGVIKMVKAFEHNALPKTLHVDEPSRHVDWSVGDVRLLAQAEPWPKHERPRRAGVSSFGISGTNAHVILEEAPLRPDPLDETSVAEDGGFAVGSVASGDGDVGIASNEDDAPTHTVGIASNEDDAPTHTVGIASNEDDAPTHTVGIASNEDDAPTHTVGIASNEDDAPTHTVGIGGVVPWVLSGRGTDGLRGQAERLSGFLSDGDLNVADVGLSLASRSVFEHRAVIVGSEFGELRGRLDTIARGESAGNVVQGIAGVDVGGPVFVFPGQGSQWVGMGVGLLGECPVFAEGLRRCERALAGFVDWSVEGVLLGGPGAPGLDRIDVVQPVLFAVMVALAGLWRACGVEPVAVVGHSQGEIAAAYVAGGLSLDDAARVVALRSRILAGLVGKGGIVSVSLGVADVLSRIGRWGGRIELAGVNGPTSVTVSGDEVALGEFVEECVAGGVRARLVTDTVASHSPRVDPFREELCDVLASIVPCAGDIPFYSTVTGGLLDTAGLDAEYWFSNMRQPVVFEKATRALLDDGFRVFVEVSPHPVLTFGVQETVDEALDDSDHVVVGDSLRREEGGLTRFLTSLGGVWASGVDVDWRGLFAGSGARRVQLPTYAFQRERFWLEAGSSVGDVRSIGLGSVDHPLLGAVVGLAGGEGLLFTGRVSLESDPWLADHAAMGTVLFPSTGFLDLVSHAGREVGCDIVRELALEAPLVLGEQGGVQLQVTIGHPGEDGGRLVNVFSRAERDPSESGEEEQEAWTRHATGLLMAAEDSEPDDTEIFDGVWPPEDATVIELDDIYARLSDRGLDYGPAFQCLAGVWRRDDKLFCEVCLPDDQIARARAFGLHPALFDAAFHAAVMADEIYEDGREQAGVRLPFSWSEVRIGASGASSMRACLSIGDSGELSLVAVDEDDRLVVSAGSLVVRSISSEQLQTMRRSYRESLFDLNWNSLATDSVDDMGPGAWVLVGVSDSELVRALSGDSTEVKAYTDLAELGRALDDGMSLPGRVLLDVPGLLASGGIHPQEAGTTAVDIHEGGALVEDLPRRVQTAVACVLSHLQAWLADERFAGSRMLILTRGAHAVSAGEAVGVDGLIGCGVWGLVRSAQSENPDRFVLIDVEARQAGHYDDNTSLESLLSRALASAEPQLAIRDGGLLVPRLAKAGSSGGALVVPEDVDGWRLEAGSGGTFEDLSFIESTAASEPLGVGEVRVGVRAAGLNFRDIVVALGMVPTEAYVGSEGAGVVLEVGPGVEGFAVGDRVMGLLVRGFGPVVVTDHRLLASVPDEWSFLRAASVPIVFLTAYYALVDLAGVKSGERVLVHAAAGGVGMAAVQIAKHLGAEVFGTASAGKWETLRSLGLDEAHIASSRTLDFKEQFLEQTNGEGVDVVLDSLAREFVDASLEMMVGGGRFVEMGKTDIRDPNEVAADHPGVAYTTFSLEDAGPDRIQELLGEIVELFEQGVLSCLPVVSWDMRRAPEAFRFMSQARHIGKIVLTLPSQTEPEGTVLVTGGTGGLGSLVARHLVVEHRVQSLMLVSRRGMEAPGAGELRDELESLGAQVAVLSCDVSDGEEVRRLLEQVPVEFPLRGVVHVAGALDDGVIGSLNEERVARVLAPKVDAAWSLHELTEHLDLSMFVLFSSASATLGSPGQGNYAAANGFLDALAAYRRARGLAGTSIGWAQWEQTSEMAGGLSEVDLARMARQGMLRMSSEEGLGLFDLAQASDRPMLVGMCIDAAAVRAQARTGLLPVLMSDLAGVPARRSIATGSLARRLANVSEAERESMAIELVRSEVAVVLGHSSANAIDPLRAFKDLGFDSLAAVELRNRLNTSTGLRLPATIVFDCPNSTLLARHLLNEVAGVDQRKRSVAIKRTGAGEDLIAIVGMSCRYPGGVRSPEDLWSLVAEDRDAIDGFPTDRGWNLDGLFDPDPEHVGTSYVREGGFLYDAGNFDPDFFGISPREALAMDPQQRLFLEVCWEALEYGGIDPASLRGSRTGVFVGATHQSYGVGVGRVPDSVEAYLGTGVAASVLSGRVAYTLGLEGPAVTVDTACSSSLVALHLACGALRLGDCSLAIAGGVTVLVSTNGFVEFSRQGGLAPDGRCKSFADAADGTGLSEGVGAVLLERLSDAQRNGHRVLALVRGSATNQDGASNGLTAPNGPSQERVIQQALANARLSSTEVDVVEAHGTGTTLGDPIEARALLATYGRERPQGSPLLLGSLKSNIGHAQAAAGVAGVIKMVKALEHEVLPRTLHVDRPSRHVDWTTGDVSLLTEQTPWERNGKPRRAGVSSFGISGTNAHLILEEPPAVAPAAPDVVGGCVVGGGVLGVGGVVPWVLSGRGVGGLRGQAGRLGEFLGGAGRVGVGVGDVGLSLAGRSLFGGRAVVVGEDWDGLLGGVGGVADGVPVAGVVDGVTGSGDNGRAVFMFPGQGSQWVGMGVGLLDECPVFAGLLGECDEVLSGFVDWSVVGVLRGEVGAPGLDRVDVVQPVLFAVMVALAGLWRACGVEPDAVVGHSQGEIAAAVVAGGLSLVDGARVVVARSRVLAGLSGAGGMLSVALGFEGVCERIEGVGGVSVAAVNGPSSVVLSGDVGVLEQLLAGFEGDGVRARLIGVDYAAHSVHVEAIRDELLAGCVGIEPCSGGIPFYSSVTGGLFDTAGLDGEYWYRNLREMVRFDGATRSLLGDGFGVFVEVSPHPVLTFGVGETVDEATGEGGATDGGGGVVVGGSLRRGEGGLRRFLLALGEVWVCGVGVDWVGVFGGCGAVRVGLPSYAFQRERFWLESVGGVGDVRSVGLGFVGHPLLGAVLGLAGGDGWVFSGRVGLDGDGWLADHAVLGSVLFPGAGFLELVLCAGREVGCGVVRELVLESPLVLGDGGVRLQVVVGELGGDGCRSVSVFSGVDGGFSGDGVGGEWVRHASGVLAVDGVGGGSLDRVDVGVFGGVWPPEGSVEVGVDGVYAGLADVGLDYGPVFQGLVGAWRCGGDVFCEVRLPEGEAGRAGGFGLHPALFDSALHGAVLIEGFGVDGVGDGGVRLPFSWGEVSLGAVGATSLRVRLSSAPDGALSMVAVDETGALVVSVDSLRTRSVPSEQLQIAHNAHRESLFELEWVPVPMESAAESAIENVHEWVVLGPGDSHLAQQISADTQTAVRTCESLKELDKALDQGQSPPEIVLLDVRTPAERGAAETGLEDGLGAGPEGAPMREELPGEVHDAVCGVLDVLHELLANERFSETRLVIVGSAVVQARFGDGVGGLVGCGVWGLVRSAQSEHPGRFVLVDVGVGVGVGGCLGVVVSCGESVLVVRDGEVLCGRLGRVGVGGRGLLVPGGVGEWCLDVGGGGSFEDLSLVERVGAGEPLGVGEVRVGVRAAGLNFRDVLVSLGMYPGEAFVGAEGAGVVLEVGPGVDGLAVGDRVMGMLVRGFGPVAVTDHRVVVPIPEGWSFARAASVPVAFLTAYYALVDLAGVKGGERVLVHAAAGGVGMAAVQIAEHLGAEVFGTASEGKWGSLRALGLDGAHIASSRTLEFGERFLEQTDGAGVDVVLDSLAGEFVDASLGLLGEGGRFIEMGKTDIRDPGELAGEHPGVAYTVFDLADAGPGRIQEMLCEIVGLLERGALSPLPVFSWDMRRAPEAFRFMSQARHTGKIVLTLPAPVEAEGTVLVTGGTGGLGALVAKHLVVEHGVRSLVLASRSGIEAKGARELQSELEGLGARVSVVACDVSDRQALQGLLERVPVEFPLRGVVHAAGVLDDGVIGSLTAERVQRVMAPKVDAAWHLHELTQGMDLSMFVLYSSGAATMGAPGQGNYAAANSFLDGLAAHRRARGLSGLSIAWGYWEQQSALTGQMSESDLARMGRQGILPISTSEGLGLFDLAQRSSEPALVAVRLDAAVMRSQARNGQLPLLMSALVRAPARRTADNGSLTRRLANIPVSERENYVLELLRGEIAVVLGHTTPNAINPERAFKDLGFDSLAAVELRNRLNTLTGLHLPATLVFDYPNTTTLTQHLLQQTTGTASDSRPVVVRTGKVDDDPIAIVGMSCRYPGGVRSPEDLWRLVADGGDAIGGFPSDRGWDLEGLFDPEPDHPGTSYVRDGGFVYDATKFDAGFFGIGPREALAMDPQQRLLLEAGWEAFEHANIHPSTLRGSQTGVFAGVSYHDYATNMTVAPEGLEGYIGTGASGSVASGRLSYVFGLEGPAMTVDTACSSSLVALHLACQSLRSGECSLALAGGVTVLASPRVFVEFSRQRALAPDGRCKSFADVADGAGFSEGVGIVLVERLSDARRNGHRVLAVVRGSASNQDGASNGLTAPNGPSQERVIRQALANAGLSPAQVDAVEGHGTGTTLGDPIEAQALLATYGRERPQERPLWLGSVKSNIGHTQAAAGVAGVIKMVKALEHGVLPRTLHVDEPTRHVDWSAGSVSLLVDEKPWERNGERRRAGVSSFGISGTNVHVIVEEAPEQEPTPLGGLGPAKGGEMVPAKGNPEPARGGILNGGGPLPWVLSGTGENGLRGQAERLNDFIDNGTGADDSDVGFSLAGRSVFSHRAVVVGGDRDELSAGADGVARGTSFGSVVRGMASNGDTDRVVFMFPGQGSQWVGMGVGLLDECPVFAGLLGECDEVLSGFVDWSVVGVLRGEVGAPGLDRVDVVQPVLFAVMVALAGLWRACGVEPDAVVGHSQGEIAAAVVAGGLSLVDGARVVVARSRVLAGLSGAGGMLSVALGFEGVCERIEGVGGVSVAAVNGPSSVVLSGDVGVLEGLLAGFEGDGVRARLIGVDYAAHSVHVEAIRDELLAGCVGIEPCSGGIPFYSSVTGGLFDTAGLDGEYWYRNLREMVRFDGATRSLLGDGFGVFVEVSPHPVLTFGVGETVDEATGEGGATDGGGGVVVGGSLRRGEGGLRRFLLALGEVWVCGVGVDWVGVFGGCGAVRVGLPSYAFQRERFWLESVGGVGDVRSVGLGFVGHPLLGAVLGLAGGDGWVFSGRVGLDGDGWLADHAVLGSVLFPGAGFLELVLCAGREVGCGVVRELVLESPLVLGDGGVRLQVVVGELGGDGCRSVSVFSCVDGGFSGDGVGGEWVRHASGVLAVDGVGGGSLDRVDVGVFGGVWPPEGSVEVGVDGVYAGLADVGLDYGPVFQGLVGAWRCGGDVFCEVRLPEGEAGRAGGFGLHPALFDSALHGAVLIEGFGVDGVGDGGVRLPFSWGEVSLGAVGATSLRVRLSGSEGEGGDGVVSLLAVDEQGTLVLSVGSLLTREVSPQQLQATRAAQHEWLFGVEWLASTVSGPEAGKSTDAPGEMVLLGSSDSHIARALAGAGATIRAYSDLSTLLEAYGDGSPLPRTVLFDAHYGTSSEPLDGEHAALLEALSVLQGWLSDEQFSESRLVVLSTDAVAVRADDEVQGLGSSGIWGLVRSAQAEHPDRFVLIDVDRREGAIAADDLSFEVLLHTALAGGEPQLAIRGNDLLVPRLVKVARSAELGTVTNGVGADGDGELKSADVERGLGPDCTVLITGGTGGLGALVARHLIVEHGVTSLMLVSRRGIEAPGATELRQELEALGASVRVEVCDASDRIALAGLLEQIPVEYPLRGVVHAAGVLDDGVIESLSVERIERVLAAKADAAWHLHELTEKLDLSMFVLFSSAAGTVGSAGQGNYAAANSYLDSLAAYRRARKLAATSIAWGFWQQTSDMTQGLGEADLARMGRQGIVPLSVEDGLALFDTALGSDQATLVAMAVDTATLRAQARNRLLPALMSALVRVPVRRAADEGSLARRLASVAPAEREALVLDLVCGEVAMVLGHSSSTVIDPDRAFKDLGFDSLAAVELRNGLNRMTGLRLPATLVFDYPNSAALARHLLGQLDHGEGSSSASLDTELDKVERLLPQAKEDHAERVRIAARLETILATLSDAHDGEDVAASGEDDLLSATDDELFELIDNELGAS